jgi:hypothetical protein
MRVLYFIFANMRPQERGGAGEGVLPATPKNI